MGAFDFVLPLAPPRTHPWYDALSIALAATYPNLSRNALAERIDDALTWDAQGIY
jgi:hypothetical protein